MKLLGLAMALAKRHGNDYGIRYDFSSREYKVGRLGDRGECEFDVLVFYRYGYDDYKYDRELIDSRGWRIKYDNCVGYWMIKE